MEKKSGRAAELWKYFSTFAIQTGRKILSMHMVFGLKGQSHDMMRMLATGDDF